MGYFDVFTQKVQEFKDDESVAAILLIGKTAKVKDTNFDHLNDSDL
jgi:hypothetical protein